MIIPDNSVPDSPIRKDVLPFDDLFDKPTLPPFTPALPGMPLLLFCLLVDVSGSIAQQEKINRLNQALMNFRNEFASLNHFDALVEICVISFCSEVKIVTPFTDIRNFHVPVLSQGVDAPSIIDGVLCALEAIRQEVNVHNGETYFDHIIHVWKPFVLLITDNVPRDDISILKPIIDKCEKSRAYGYLRFHAFGFNGANTDVLYTLTNRVMAIRNYDFDSTFSWASKTVRRIIDGLDGYPPTEADMILPIRGKPFNWD